MQSFNDDDWYELDSSMKVVRSYGRRSFTYQCDPIVLVNGNIVVKGMRAKYMIK